MPDRNHLWVFLSGKILIPGQVPGNYVYRIVTRHTGSCEDGAFIPKWLPLLLNVDLVSFYLHCVTWRAKEDNPQVAVGLLPRLQEGIADVALGT